MVTACRGRVEEGEETVGQGRKNGWRERERMREEGADEEFRERRKEMNGEMIKSE